MTEQAVIVLKKLMQIRPGWAKGSLSEDDMTFLFRQVYKNKPKKIVEIGTASGVSSAIILGAMSFYQDEGTELHCYDIMHRCYFNWNRRVGSAIDEMIPEQLSNVTVHTQKSILNLGEQFEENTVDFLFIDANHKHPFPALDTIVALKYVKEGGIIIHHDINLPIINPKFQTFGAKYVFDLPFDKFHKKDVAIPNIGGFRVKDKGMMKETLLNLVQEKKWDQEVEQTEVDKYINYTTLESNIK